VQTRRVVPVQALHLGNQQIALAEEGADVELVDGRPPAQDAAGQVDGAQRQAGQHGGRDVDGPLLGLHGDNAADDEVADLGGVARAQGLDGEQLVGLVQVAGDGGDDGGGVGGDVSAVAAHPLRVRRNGLAGRDDGRGALHGEAVVVAHVVVRAGVLEVRGRYGRRRREDGDRHGGRAGDFCGWRAAIGRLYQAAEACTWICDGGARVGCVVSCCRPRNFGGMALGDRATLARFVRKETSAEGGPTSATRDIFVQRHCIQHRLRLFYKRKAGDSSLPGVPVEDHSKLPNVLSALQRRTNPSLSVGSSPFA
jgi:hypothetical protein